MNHAKDTKNNDESNKSQHDNNEENNNNQNNEVCSIDESKVLPKTQIQRKYM